MSVDAIPPDDKRRRRPEPYVQVVTRAWPSSASPARFSTARCRPTPLERLRRRLPGNDDGDATVVYDRLSKLGVISQFSVSTTPYLMCVAVSTGADPTGSTTATRSVRDDVPDYPSCGVAGRVLRHARPVRRRDQLRRAKGLRLRPDEDAHRPGGDAAVLQSLVADELRSDAALRRRRGDAATRPERGTIPRGRLECAPPLEAPHRLVDARQLVAVGPVRASPSPPIRPPATRATPASRSRGTTTGSMRSATA